MAKNYQLKIKVPRSLILKNGAKGSFAPLVDALNYTTNDNNDFRYYTLGDYSHLDAIGLTDLFKENLPLSLAFTIVETSDTDGLKGEIEGYPAFLELDDPDVAVPADFVDRTYLDDQGVEQVHTFRTYTKAGSDYPIQIGSKHYIALDNLIVEPPFSHLVSIKSSVISIDDYKAL